MPRKLSSYESSRSNLLLDQLLKAGLLTKDQIDVILFDHASTSIPIHEILLQRGWIKEQTITYFIHSTGLSEIKAPPTQSIEQQIDRLRQQQDRLKKAKIALEQEVKNLRQEKDILRQFSARQRRKNLNAVDYENRTAPDRHLDSNSDSLSGPDSIKWIG
ncbi:hypothetical protein C1752_02423 [Acaryochloris thomasi RCC1774]|uniref:Uncharacterized protein n=1 Tax=Acaryochloris thomasi RCC1774 TaxID=1764569 RepID=A0A2W1JXG2_9CYAN|nr:hypothetical protein [Acaryochloris thomasi]PZD73331.1 hypothetical protein C1752_02423 [Acaryochloris thomasi RCC1774]